MIATDSDARRDRPGRGVEAVAANGSGAVEPKVGGSSLRRAAFGYSREDLIEAVASWSARDARFASRRKAAGGRGVRNVDRCRPACRRA